MERLKNVGVSDSDNASRRKKGKVKDKDKVAERPVEKGSVEDILSVEEGMLPNTRGGFSVDMPLGMKTVVGDDGKVRFPWEKKPVEKKDKRKNDKTLAELTIPARELSRLRILGFGTKKKMKIGSWGVTQEVVEAIHDKWKASEIVRLKFEGTSAVNMKRMHEILERKAGGMVIWRSGTSVILYRGATFEVPSVQLNKITHSQNRNPCTSSSTATNKTIGDSSRHGSCNGNQTSQKSLETNAEDLMNQELLPDVKYEDEIDELLDSLGPRFTDWPGEGPSPVDADLLPRVVPDYQPPFRILPYKVRRALSSKEATDMRRLARALPPHFAVGRSRPLQGLALAMAKLWESSSIAKIGLKRGVQLTTSERMAEDIKKLTGGILLSRNKEFLLFYRGKDFLSKEVAQALLERERWAKALQDEEEKARMTASGLIEPNVAVTADQPGTAGTLGETLAADTLWGTRLDVNHIKKMMKETERERHAKLLKKLEGKLYYVEKKLCKAENALSKVEAFLKPSQPKAADPESITDEERFMFRKLGLRMKAFLLLGRRGVFDGTVENMHLHWKYRELVRIRVNAKCFDQVRKIALSLEAESGGVLVSIDKISKGYAVIVFRGKEYRRPQTMRPKNLLTKRKALARSIELQRQEALNKHISALRKNVQKLKSEVEQMETVKDQGDKELYDKLDSTYPTDDEESEEEGDEAYDLETYGGESDDAENELMRAMESDSWTPDLCYPSDVQIQAERQQPQPSDL